MKKLLSFILGLHLFLLSPTQAQEVDFAKKTQEDIMLVSAAAAGGAVLGLSTLSFVDKPSQHISNIWTGAALGVIAGVIFVAYNSAQKSQEELQSSSDFRTSERVAWHAENSPNLTLPKVQFGTQIWQSSF
ncbi:MAG TPA: hypothetical protein VNJ01_16160 [Bacteriovoracaceae bacterium]|nr:hypothetical protein [Bacteriovoracaceae bacterium]